MFQIPYTLNQAQGLDIFKKAGQACGAAGTRRRYQFDNGAAF